MTKSETERTSGNPFPTGTPEAGKYYKTTITDDEGNKSTGCDRSAEKSQEKAADKFERAQKK